MHPVASPIRKVLQFLCQLTRKTHKCLPCRNISRFWIFSIRHPLQLYVKATSSWSWLLTGEIVCLSVSLGTRSLTLPGASPPPILSGDMQAEPARSHIGASVPPCHPLPTRKPLLLSLLEETVAGFQDLGAGKYVQALHSLCRAILRKGSQVGAFLTRGFLEWPQPARPLHRCVSFSRPGSGLLNLGVMSDNV